MVIYTVFTWDTSAGLGTFSQMVMHIPSKEIFLLLLRLMDFFFLIVKQHGRRKKKYQKN